MNDSDSRKDIVLVIEDSPESLSMINDTLDQAGYKVLVSLDGFQALTITENITPDIILLDAMMPGMDGFETCLKLKEKSSLGHVPVIFMTGLTDTDSIVKALDAGGVDYISKPINCDELLARMRVHLNNARLMLSARDALDHTGQFYFSATADGQLIWTTPQTDQLLQKAGMTQDLMTEHLPSLLHQLLTHQQNKDKSIEFRANKIVLSVHYISEISSNEHLLSLVDPERPGESELLRNAFSLTNRESEVLLWVAMGKTNREIGLILSLSPRTVNKHLEQIFRKLGVENRTAAATRALKILH